jgi:hypothetical protein
VAQASQPAVSRVSNPLIVPGIGDVQHANGQPIGNRRYQIKANQDYSRLGGSPRPAEKILLVGGGFGSMSLYH